MKKNEKTEPQMREYNDASEHPSPEQLLLRLALKNLTVKQRQLWELYAYDQLSQEEIAEKLNINQSSVSRRLIAIENQIKAFYKQNKGAYMLLKLEQRIMEE